MNCREQNMFLILGCEFNLNSCFYNDKLCPTVTSKSAIQCSMRWMHFCFLVICVWLILLSVNNKFVVIDFAEYTIRVKGDVFFFLSISWFADPLCHTHPPLISPSLLMSGRWEVPDRPLCTANRWGYRWRQKTRTGMPYRWRLFIKYSSYFSPSRLFHRAVLISSL